MKIPPSARANNLTAGLLNRPDGIPVPPLFFSEGGGKSAVILYYLGKNVCGHPGIVHGGLLATILDEGLARCCFPALPNKVGMTASLKVEYKAPVPAESFVVLRAETRRVEGRKAWVVGRVESLPVDGGEGRVFVEAEALFIEPRQAAVSFPSVFFFVGWGIEGDGLADFLGGRRCRGFIRLLRVKESYGLVERDWACEDMAVTTMGRWWKYGQGVEDRIIERFFG